MICFSCQQKEASALVKDRIGETLLAYCKECYKEL